MRRACKFCGCTQTKPCVFPATFLSPENIIDQPELTPCSWWLVAPREAVCNAPACVEKAYGEARERMIALEIEMLGGREIEIADRFDLEAFDLAQYQELAQLGMDAVAERLI